MMKDAPMKADELTARNTPVTKSRAFAASSATVPAAAPPILPAPASSSAAAGSPAEGKGAPSSAMDADESLPGREVGAKGGGA